MLGSKIGNAIADGTVLPLFKFCSMTGGIIFCNGGHISWIGDHLDRTSLSSCEAEIRATNSNLNKVVDFCNLCRSMAESGHTLADITSLAVIYNNNNACVKWSHNMTSKAARHIEFQENSVCEWIQDNTPNVLHVSGKTNTADIFIQEM